MGWGRYWRDFRSDIDSLRRVTVSDLSGSVRR